MEEFKKNEENLEKVKAIEAFLNNRDFFKYITFEDIKDVCSFEFEKDSKDWKNAVRLVESLVIITIFLD